MPETPSLNALANAYRARYVPDPTAGFVVFYDGILCGWLRTLTEPQHWSPGAIALDIDGNRWTTTGGDRHSGALRWIPDPRR